MPRPVQEEIPGTGAPKIPEIEKAAANYVNARDARMELTTKEVTAKKSLITVCQEHVDEMPKNEKGERIYRYGDDLEVALIDKINVKVRHAGDTDQDED